MNIIEESKRLKESSQAHQAKIPELEKELIETTRAQLELDEEALKSEILEERGWQKKKEKAEENRARTLQIKAEIEKHKTAIEIIRGKQKEIRLAVMKEFKEKYRGECEADLREYAKRLKEAAEFEAKLIERRNEIRREIIGVLSNGMGSYELPSTIMPAFQPILTDGPFTPLNFTQYEHFRRNCLEEGIRID